MAQQTQIPTLEELRERFEELEEKITDEDESPFYMIRHTLSDRKDALDELREAGYHFRAFVDKAYIDAREKFHEAEARLGSYLHDVEFRKAMENVRQKLEAISEGGRRQGGPTPEELKALEESIAALEEKLEAAESEIEDAIRPLQSALSGGHAWINRAKFALEQVSEATFDLQSGEHIVAASDANWEAEEKKGILYLTDQRIIFEQKEEKGGGFLGLGKKDKFHEVAFQFPLSEVNVKQRDEGFLGHKDFVDIQGPGGTVSVEVTSHGNNDWWEEQIAKVKSGALEAFDAVRDEIREREAEIKQKEADFREKLAKEAEAVRAELEKAAQAAAQQARNRVQGRRQTSGGDAQPEEDDDARQQGGGQPGRGGRSRQQGKPSRQKPKSRRQ
jgi:hypothetical protein